jgi:hypothetical protein
MKWLPFELLREYVSFFVTMGPHTYAGLVHAHCSRRRFKISLEFLSISVIYVEPREGAFCLQSCRSLQKFIYT